MALCLQFFRGPCRTDCQLHCRARCQNQCDLYFSFVAADPPTAFPDKFYSITRETVFKMSNLYSLSQSTLYQWLCPIFMPFGIVQSCFSLHQGYSSLIATVDERNVFAMAY